jgi:cell division protein FtsI/penicillin-binding protein 2/beta-lactamase regulating signal transducer with metallopeptidase domain
MVRAGWMLVHSLWQGAGIALLTWALLRFLRRPAVRATAAFVAMTAMLACLPVTWVCLQPGHASAVGKPAPFIEWESVFANDSTERVPQDGADARAAGSMPADSSAARGAQPAKAPPVAAADSQGREWTGWTACVWLIGVLLLGLLRAGGWLQVWRWRTRGVEPAPPELRDCLRAAAAKTGMFRACGIRLSRLVRSPLICGCWRPVILFPLSLLSMLDRQQIEALLIHELTHLRRRDFLMNAIQLLIETLLFYHPAVWWAGRRLREYREHACDDAAVRAGAEPLSYAKTLACVGSQWNSAAVSAGGGSLLDRVRRVLTGRETAIPAPTLTGLLPLLAAIICFGARIESKTDAAEAVEPAEKKEASNEVRYRYRWQRWGDRGLITDRRGTVLARNAERWSLLIEPRMVREDYQRLTGKASLQRPSQEPNQPPVDDIPAMLAELFIASGMPELKELATTGSPLSERYTRWLRRFHAEVTPWPAAAPVTFTQEQLPRLTDAVKNWRCARLTRAWQREYPLGARAAHTIGHSAKDPDQEVRGRLLDPAFRQSPEGRHAMYEPWITGRVGVEQLMDSTLQGQEWYQNGHFDNHRGIVFDDEAPHPVNGPTVRLTLEARVQAIAEEALRGAGVGRGAAVVLDVNNGDILAMASAPSYDPAIFVSGIRADDFQRLLKDGTLPLLGRALANYSPGSIFKLVTALAAARAGKSGLSFTCDGALMFGERSLKCWIATRGGTHGVLDLESALKCSCNVYFYKMASEIGADRIGETAGLFGIGREPGLLGGSQSGHVNTPEVAKARGGNWFPAMTAIMGIGQGDVAVTPVQMANVAAAIGNGGRIWKRRLMLDTLPAGTDPAQAPAPSAGELVVNLLEHGITPEAIEKIRRGMWAVVNEPGGTGMNARSAIGIAGKSGTAERHRSDGKGGTIRDTTTWFLAFAPYDAPRYAVCVVVENGEAGGQTCAPIAKRILEQSIAAEKSGEPIVPLRGLPLQGHLDKVDAVVYPEDVK